MSARLVDYAWQVKKQDPSPWRYCKSCMDRTIHQWNATAKRWECLGCEKREALQSAHSIANKGSEG